MAESRTVSLLGVRGAGDTRTQRVPAEHVLGFLSAQLPSPFSREQVLVGTTYARRQSCSAPSPQAQRERGAQVASLRVSGRNNQTRKRQTHADHQRRNPTLFAVPRSLESSPTHRTGIPAAVVPSTHLLAAPGGLGSGRNHTGACRGKWEEVRLACSVLLQGPQAHLGSPLLLS